MFKPRQLPLPTSCQTLLVVLIASATFTTTVHANGLIISPIRVDSITPMPRIDESIARRPIHSWMPFQISSQTVDVTINEAVSDTTLEQVFINRSGQAQEGQYLFPIAENAGVHKFTMWMNGKEVVGELLDADKARGIYEAIVAKARDPGLLQFVGRGLIQAKVFPVPAGGECRIRLRYTEPMKIDGGLAGYRFPLGSTACQFQPIERFSMRATIRSERPLISVFSPSHECSVDRRGEREAVVGLEKQRLTPEGDFQLFAQLGTDAFGLSLLPYRLGEDEGFFMARIAPRIGSQNDAVQPKNICFVLDTSGSMADSNKIGQAKKALQFCVTNLNKEDRFTIITFATEIRPFREDWSLADDTSKNAARQFIEGLNAVGGTDINGAMTKALAMRPSASRDGNAADRWRENPYLVVFITDGEPTVGVTNPDEIVKNITTANADKAARVFSLGVGIQVNTKLLDRLSDDNGGARDYVTPTEDLELKISSFYTKLANPILSNITLAFDGVSIHDMYPKQLPDMFQGSELVVVGRYSGIRGSQQITLSGTSRGEKRTYNYACAFPSQDSRHEFLPRFWAMRKIGFLLDELRLRGETQEVKNEVIRLAKLYGVLTPYTSYLVQEDEQLAVRERRDVLVGRPAAAPMVRARAERKDDYEDAKEGQTASVGYSATTATKGNQRMRAMDCDAASNEIKLLLEGNCDSTGRQLINFVGPRTFYNEGGDKWVEAAYDGKSETYKVTLYSREYYDLLKQHTGLGNYLAQSERVIVKCGDRWIETLPSTDAKPDSAKN